MNDTTRYVLSIAKKSIAKRQHGYGWRGRQAQESRRSSGLAAIKYFVRASSHRAVRRTGRKSAQVGKRSLVLVLSSFFNHCFRKTHNYALKHNLVAVSWTRQPSVRESSESDKYSLKSLHEYRRGETVVQRNLLDIRNSVLDRVVSYLEARNMEIFWIDKACIDQTNAKKKAEAIISMDLVYKNATKALDCSQPQYMRPLGLNCLGVFSMAI
jgi:hypothetical protein